MHLTQEEIERRAVYQWAKSEIGAAMEGRKTKLPFELTRMIFNVSRDGIGKPTTPTKENT